MKQSLFISYAHSDQKYVDEFVKFLQLEIRDGLITTWDDRKIKPGADWQQEITKAIMDCTTAVLLVSQDFLASDYVQGKELPLILDRAQKQGIRIFWIPLGHSTFERHWLELYQAASNPNKPLKDQGKSRREKQWLEISKKLILPP